MIADAFWVVFDGVVVVVVVVEVVVVVIVAAGTPDSRGCEMVLVRDASLSRSIASL